MNMEQKDEPRPKDDEFYRWLAEINMRFLKNRGSASGITWGITDNCNLFGELVSPQRVGEELQRKPEEIQFRTALFFQFMKRLKDFNDKVLRKGRFSGGSPGLSSLGSSMVTLGVAEAES